MRAFMSDRGARSQPECARNPQVVINVLDFEAESEVRAILQEAEADDVCIGWLDLQTLNDLRGCFDPADAVVESLAAFCAIESL